MVKLLISQTLSKLRSWYELGQEGAGRQYLMFRLPTVTYLSFPTVPRPTVSVSNNAFFTIHLELSIPLSYFQSLLICPVNSFCHIFMPNFQIPFQRLFSSNVSSKDSADSFAEAMVHLITTQSHSISFSPIFFIANPSTPGVGKLFSLRAAIQSATKVLGQFIPKNATYSFKCSYLDV